MRIEVVPDETGACPLCGAYWGHPDPALDFPNRSKVHDGDEWWWRCYNPACDCGYWVPGRPDLGYEPKPTPERVAAQEAEREAMQVHWDSGTWEQVGPNARQFVPAPDCPCPRCGS